MIQVKTQTKDTTIALKEDEFKLNFKLHTIILLVGPDGSGKTKFAKEVLIPQLSRTVEYGKKRVLVTYAGLDPILIELLNTSFLRDHFYTTQVTEQANDMLFNKIKNFSSYPVNSDFIIVDSDGLDQEFRAEIQKIGEENHYNVAVVIFNYKDKKQHYVMNHETGNPNASPSHQMRILKRLVSGELSKKEYSSLNTIQYREFDKYEVSIPDYSEYDQYILPNKDYVIFGDIHGCYQEFVDLLHENGFIIDDNLKVTHPLDKAVLLAGDIIDKGYAIKEVIELVYANLDTFYMVMGNHESLVYKKLSGSLAKGGLPSADVVGEFFNTIEMLAEPQRPTPPRELKEEAGEEALSKYKELVSQYEKNLEIYNSIPASEFENRKELREKFLKIAESMKSFYVYKNFIVTHSPCEKKYLGKISSKALKATRDFRYPKIRDYESYAEFMYEFDERIKFLKDEASDFHPIHVFGHVMSKEMSMYKNKINIDTACVAGGELTSIEIDSKRKISSKSIKSTLENSEHKQLHKFFY